MVTVLAIDASIIVYQQFASVGHLCTKEKEPTGLRFGFLRAVASYAKKFSADKVAIVWDGQGPIQKAEGIADYKGNRVVTPQKEQMWSQVPALKEMIGLTYWSQVWADGFEADDVIGTVARQMVAKGHKVVIVTSDNDMSQLISKDIQIYVPGKDARLKSWQDVLDEFGVCPDLLVYYRAFAGDVSDNLSRVLGHDQVEQYRIGLCGFKLPVLESTVVEWTREWMNQGVLTRGQFPKWEQNLKAMKLQAPANVTVQKGARDKTKLFDLFQKLEFKSMLPRVDELTRAEN